VGAPADSWCMTPLAWNMLGALVLQLGFLGGLIAVLP